MVSTRTRCRGTTVLILVVIAVAANAGETSRGIHQGKCGPPPESALASFAEAAAESDRYDQAPPAQRPPIKNSFPKPSGDVPKLFDDSCWGIVSSTDRVIASSTPTKILLLKSVYPTTADGTGMPQYAANLLIARGGRVLYQAFPTVPLWNSTAFKVAHSWDEDVDIRDVTGDGIPEILFTTAYCGASSCPVDVHVVRLNPKTQRFSEAFTFHISAWWTRLRWMTRAGHVYAVVADGVCPDDPDDPEGLDCCHQCPKRIALTVYEWDGGRNSFVVRAHEITSQKFGDALDALKDYQLPASL